MLEWKPRTEDFSRTHTLKQTFTHTHTQNKQTITHTYTHTITGDGMKYDDESELKRRIDVMKTNSAVIWCGNRFRYVWIQLWKIWNTTPRWKIRDCWGNHFGIDTLQVLIVLNETNRSSSRDSYFAARPANIYKTDS